MTELSHKKEYPRIIQPYQIDQLEGRLFENIIHPLVEAVPLVEAAALNRTGHILEKAIAVVYDNSITGTSPEWSDGLYPRAFIEAHPDPQIPEQSDK